MNNVQQNSHALNAVVIREGERTIVRVADWDLDLGGADGELVVSDTVLAEKLGFDRPRKIRELIERIWPTEEARRAAGVITRATVSRVTAKGGATREQPVVTYQLGEFAALKLVTRSRTPVADALTDQMIRVFMAARRGLLGQPVPAPAALPAPEPAPRLLLRELNATTGLILSQVDELERQLAQEKDQVRQFTALAKQVARMLDGMRQRIAAGKQTLVNVQWVEADREPVSRGWHPMVCLWLHGE